MFDAVACVHARRRVSHPEERLCFVHLLFVYLSEMDVTVSGRTMAHSQSAFQNALADLSTVVEGEMEAEVTGGGWGSDYVLLSDDVRHRPTMAGVFVHHIVMECWCLHKHGRYTRGGVSGALYLCIPLVQSVPEPVQPLVQIAPEVETRERNHREVMTKCSFANPIASH